MLCVRLRENLVVSGSSDHTVRYANLQHTITLDQIFFLYDFQSVEFNQKTVHFRTERSPCEFKHTHAHC